MLNYANLNDLEFEYLCQDIMQKKLNLDLHRFAKGKDGGIDLSDNVNTKNVIVQVKHYMDSTVPKLISVLKDEAVKIARLAPKEYYVCCSKELSPQRIDEIYNMFTGYMSSPSNIITLNEIDDFLTSPENSDVLQKHYKLWIESTGILQEIGNSNIFIDCESLLSDIENEKNLFVKTSAFNSALSCLDKNKTLFITGHPGVGKTITSKMLVLHYAANGYRVRFSTNVSDLDELKKSLSRNPDIKEIILVDDCFGQAYFNMKESQNTELLALINYVNASPNKLLILNSRITILQEAKERKPELLKCFEGKQCKVYILDMNAIDIVEKARIFYNHISFNGMDAEYFKQIKKDKRYFDIIKHHNYTPRIIEFICNPNRYRNVPAENYYEFAMQQLNNPKEIWKDEYERRLEKVDRLLLLTLYSLSDSAVSEQKVRVCFEHRISCEQDIDTTINQYEASLNRLLDSFVQMLSEDRFKKLSMVNPSVNDYIDGRLKASTLEKEQLIDKAFSMQQKKRLLSETEFDAFVKNALINHEIDNYLFDSRSQKNAFVAYYVCQNNIHDHTYAPYIKGFLDCPCYFSIYGNYAIPPIIIFREIFKKDICDFYKIGEFITNECLLDTMLIAFVFDNMIEVIRTIDRYFIGEKRNEFIKICSEMLGVAIDSFCGNLDADEFDPDVDYAIDMSRCGGDNYDGIDISKAASYIEDDIISEVEDDIRSYLSMLPTDIEQYRDYTKNLEFYIYGAEDLVNSYLAYDYDDYEHYREQHQDYEDSHAEIDYIFSRDTQ